jgi:hypothetical protein
MISSYDRGKLLDDIKIIAKAVKIAREENNPDNRKYACGLVENLLNRLYNDITEMTKGDNQTEEYDGSSQINMEGE